MTMGCAPVVIDLDDYNVGESWKGSDSKSDTRLERRWKRRESLLSNERLKGNEYERSDTRSVVKSCRKVEILTVNNGHTSEEEIDEDYLLFLASYIPNDIDSVRDGIVDGFDNDINIDYNHNDSCDVEYRTFLGSYSEEEGIEVGKQGIDSVKNQKGGPRKSQQNLEAKRGVSMKRPRGHISGVPKDDCHSSMELDFVDEDYQIFLNSCSIRDDCLVFMPKGLNGKSSSVMRNLQVADHAFNSPQVVSEIDEDYQQFLNSVRLVDGELEYMPQRNTSNKDIVDDDTNSSASDLVLLEPNQIHENTPFVSSKKYDASWFTTEMNSRDNQDDSQFRTRLMNDLQKPFDQEEFDRLMFEVHQKRQKERHVETRQGVVKSYRTKGVNKSYLELYPDLGRAITQSKKPERVLFLLRGFSFWLQNVTHDGVFKPWLDKKCLDTLWKM